MPTASAHLFLHVLAPLTTDPETAIDTFKGVMEGLIAKHATRLLPL